MLNWAFRRQHSTWMDLPSPRRQPFLPRFSLLCASIHIFAGDVMSRRDANRTLRLMMVGFCSQKQPRTGTKGSNNVVAERPCCCDCFCDSLPPTQCCSKHFRAILLLDYRYVRHFEFRKQQQERRICCSSSTTPPDARRGPRPTRNSRCSQK